MSLEEILERTGRRIREHVGTCVPDEELHELENCLLYTSDAADE